MALIPDKAAYLEGIPKLSYADFANRLKEKTPFASFIDLSGSLTLDSFYKTDTHWRQEQLGDAAGTVVAAMGKKLTPVKISLSIIINKNCRIDSSTWKLYRIFERSFRTVCYCHTFTVIRHAEV